VCIFLKKFSSEMKNHKTIKLSRCFHRSLTTCGPIIRCLSSGSANRPDGVVGTCKFEEDPEAGSKYISDGFGMLGDVTVLPAVGIFVVV